MDEVCLVPILLTAANWLRAVSAWCISNALSNSLMYDKKKPVQTAIVL